jgi:ankyrin repeat protein
MTREDFTALHLATYNGHIEIVKSIVEKGKADVTEKTNQGWTALEIASSKSHLEIVKYLRQKLPHNDSSTYFAAASGDLTVFQYLFENEKFTLLYETLLGVAFNSGHSNIIEYLIAKNISAVSSQLQSEKGLTD